MAKRFNLNESDREKLSNMLAGGQQPPARKDNTRQLSPRHHFGGILFLNDSGATIPAFGVVQVDDAALDRNSPYVSAIKPAAGGRLFLINGPRDVADEDWGIGFREGRALMSGSGGGGFWSPVADEWELASGGCDFRLAGALDAETGFFLLSDHGFIRIKGVTTSAVAGDATFTINTVRAMQGADPRSDTSSDAETVTVQNRLGEHCDTAAYCEAVWDSSTNEWVSNHLDSICPE